MSAGQDVRYALRSFRSKPAFAIAVISILAIGIGATTAVFSVVDRVLFRPLPYGAADRLVSLGIRIPWLEFDFLTAGSYAELRRHPEPLVAVTSWSGVADCDWTGDRPVRLGCARVEAAVVRSFDQHVGELAARPRFQAWLLALFAGIGMLLAGFGLYGLVSFLVAQREREFGVRLALGATQAGILRLVLGDALRWTSGGLVCGLAGAAAAARALRSLLFHVAPGDPAVYAMAAAMLAALAVAAALLPSRRAARVDPATALRQD